MTQFLCIIILHSLQCFHIKYDETNHWILWNSTKDFNYDYEFDIINKVIENYLTCHTIIGTPFQFAWYKDPKTTISEFYHVQVFWNSSINSASN